MIVLTVEASQVAADTSIGQDRATRVKVIERFLFYGVNGNGRGLLVGGGIEGSADVLSHPADARLAFGDLALMWAEMALDLAATEPVKEHGFFEILGVHDPPNLPILVNYSLFLWLFQFSGNAPR